MNDDKNIHLLSKLKEKIKYFFHLNDMENLIKHIQKVVLKEAKLDYHEAKTLTKRYIKYLIKEKIVLSDKKELLKQLSKIRHRK